MEIDLTPILEIVLTLLGALLTWVAYAVRSYIQNKIGLELNVLNNKNVDDAIDRGLAYARAQLSDHTTIDVRNDLVALALGYVVQGVPRAIETFGLSEQRLEEMILARLGVDQQQ